MLQESHGTELQSLSTAAVERLRLADRNLFILQTYEKRLVCQERHMVTIRGLSVNYNSRHKVFGSSYGIIALPFVDFIEALRQPELIVTYSGNWWKILWNCFCEGAQIYFSEFTLECGDVCDSSLSIHHLSPITWADAALYLLHCTH